MNGRMARKLRRYSKQNWFEYVKAIRQWPFTVRLRFCWCIMFSKKRKGGKP